MGFVLEKQWLPLTPWRNYLFCGLQFEIRIEIANENNRKPKSNFFWAWRQWLMTLTVLYFWQSTFLYTKNWWARNVSMIIIVDSLSTIIMEENVSFQENLQSTQVWVIAQVNCQCQKQTNSWLWICDLQLQFVCFVRWKGC